MSVEYRKLVSIEGEKRPRTESPRMRRYHFGRIEDAWSAIRAEAVFNKNVDLMKLILNPPLRVPCFSSSCFIPHGIKVA